MVETTDLYPGIRFYAPMLVGKTPDNVEAYLSTDKFIGSEKKDGYWEMLIKHNDQVYMFSRSKSKKDGWYTQKAGHVPHIADWMLREMPNDTIIVGEVYLPEKTSKDITTILGCKEDKAIARQKVDGYLHFWVHDLLMYNGYDYVEREEPYFQRYSDLCRYVDLGSKLIPQVEVASCVDNIYCDLLDIAGQWIAEGKEGMVIRRENGLYLPGKRRPKEMFKIKQNEDTLDFVIMNVLPPEKYYTGKNPENWPYVERLNGELLQLKSGIRIKEPIKPVTKAYFYGWKNAFELGLYDGDHLMSIGRVASGFDDRLREDCGKNPNSYIGKVAEVSCMSLDKENLTFRHPVLIRVREDKPAGDCRLETIFS